ncbi:vanadium-dependent haloperoxidase [Bacillus sp. Marseille-Q3570]|uniref:vanadium-dependent haloperoxidase n=1 Tax=Bacillus sp. Marseille-Q3570 TaxID=2963522 RepID=UPI0021B7F9DE|nr:vanadium-dependent haloperoxidase [Bacillus sp. Marseille-Q3570]
MKRDDYLRWSEVPYGGERKPPSDPVDPLAGSWPTYFIKRKGDHFVGPDGVIHFDLRHPSHIDWDEELKVVQRTLANITPEQIQIAEYWGAGVATKQWTPIIDRLIDTYGLTPPYAARVLAAVQAGINDAFVVTWYFKYLCDVARPIQYDQTLKPILCTPRFPTYVSGHSAISGCAEVILSYFFPGEAKRLRNLAEEDSISRLYGGIHFPVDLEQGLKLGRRIGQVVVSQLSHQKDSSGEPVDTPFLEDLDADLPPPPYRQSIPYTFNENCSSNTKFSKPKKNTPLFYFPKRNKNNVNNIFNWD